jgi:PAS domain S-box-containing protein
MAAEEKVNILLVDDQPAKLLTFETILGGLGENLIRATSANEALERLLKEEIAVVLLDVFMPDLDGFELARMIREHPRFQKTAIIFVSGILIGHHDFLRGYQFGTVDYLSLPIVPDVLRAKVQVFITLYRATKMLEHANRELETRVAERTAELAASNAELSRSEARLRLALEAAQMGWWNYDVRANKLAWSSTLVRMMGVQPQSFGGTIEGVLSLVHPEDRVRFHDFIRNRMAGQNGESCELRFLRPDGSVRWSLTSGHVLRDENDQPTNITGVDVDITARKQAEERQSTLAGELDHRGKNLLAVVQSVLRLSRADTPADYVAAVEGRVKALARAHTMLSETRWESADLDRLVRDEIAPFSTQETARIAVSGPPIALRPATAQSLALVLHELVTNAAKYGALSVPAGRVAMDWVIEPEFLVVHWTERDGPTIKPPTRKGFGTAVIEAGVQRQLHGQASFEWRADGLRCTLSIPRTELETSGAAPASRSAPSRRIGRSIGRTRSILLVEDEALLGMMMKETLSGMGLSVIGPLVDLPNAVAAANESDLGGAVLDINLNGVMVYPVAEVLARRGIPFVFVSGYGAGGLDRRYADVPVLEKPVSIEAFHQMFGGSGRRPQQLAT